MAGDRFTRKPRGKPPPSLGRNEPDPGVQSAGLPGAAILCAPIPLNSSPSAARSATSRDWRAAG